MSVIVTTEIFIERAKKIHGDTYSYSKSIYTKGSDKLIITCPIHGDFNQSPNNHCRGKGCSKCGDLRTAKIRTVSNSEILKRFEKVHGDLYDYSFVNYVNSNEKVKIRCRKHDLIFEQLAYNHIKGQGCPKCGGNYRRDTTEFLKDLLNNKYDYSKSIYKSAKDKIEIICPEHGSFWQTPDNHISKNHGCPKCISIKSKIESEVYDFIKYNISTDVEFSNRKILSGKELDIYIPELKTAIEYNGLYWHSDMRLPNDYHLKKTVLCKEKNIKLIQIFGDEWMYKQDIVKSRLLNIIGKTPNKLYARKCEIREVESKDSSNFLEQNHIQGKLGAKVKLGLYYDNELVSLMTFGNLRKNLGSTSKEGSYELLRFCNKLNTTVIGGASKLFKYFITNYNPINIISYADRRWSEGNLYYNLGFKLLGETKPNYFYINLKEATIRHSRFNYRKDILIKEGFDPNKTEFEIMEQRGYVKIYDCGSLKFEYKKESF